MNQPKQPDRIQYTLGVKAPGDTQYTSHHESITLMIDVMANESLDDAIVRVKETARRHLQGEAAPRETAPTPPPAKAPPPPASAMIFDSENPLHRDMAAAVFDECKVMSERRREYLAKNFLVGRPLHQVRPIIRGEVERFKKESSIFPIRQTRRDR